jgi:hypothetical protein
MNRALQSTSRYSASAKRSSGAPARATSLSPAQRVFFERAFGQDFSQVRVHTDAAAHALTDALGAKAVTRGEDIAFAPGHYQPDSTPGRTLLAHELAHVAQQRRGSGASAQAEHQARSAAQTVAQGGSVAPEALGGARPGLYCDPDDDAKKRPETPLPPLKLTTPGPLDWLKLRESFTSRGTRLSLRDADSIEREASRISDQLAVFGIGPNFKLDYKLGTLTRDDIINLGLSQQLEDRLGAENPNAWDRMNKDWKLANPGGWSTPILSKTWKF